MKRYSFVMRNYLYCLIVQAIMSCSVKENEKAQLHIVPSVSDFPYSVIINEKPHSAKNDFKLDLDYGKYKLKIIVLGYVSAEYEFTACENNKNIIIKHAFKELSSKKSRNNESLPESEMPKSALYKHLPNISLEEKEEHCRKFVRYENRINEGIAVVSKCANCQKAEVKDYGSVFFCAEWSYFVLNEKTQKSTPFNPVFESKLLYDKMKRQKRQKYKEPFKNFWLMYGAFDHGGIGRFYEYKEGLIMFHRAMGIVTFFDVKGRAKLITSISKDGDYFSNGYLLHKKYPHYHFIYKNGRRASPFFYDAESFSERMAAVCMGEDQYTCKWGYVDAKFNIVIKNKYENAKAFSQGLAAVKLQGAWRYIDKKGKIVIKNAYAAATSFSDGVAIVKENNEKCAGDCWGIIDRAGKWISESKYKKILPFSEGLAPFDLDGKWGFIDKNGKIVIKAKYSHARPHSDGLAMVNDGKTTFFINRKGVVKFSTELKRCSDFNNGITKCIDNYHVDKNGVFVFKNRSYYQLIIHHYLDRNGQILLFENYVLPIDWHMLMKHKNWPIEKKKLKIKKKSK